MMNVKHEINHCKGLSIYKQQDYAGENYKALHSFFESKKQGQANTLLVGVIFTCIATDGKLSQDEWNFITQFIGGYSYDEALKVANQFYNTQAQKITQDLYDFLPDNLKDNFLKLCIAVLCVDGNVDNMETTFLNKLI